ncbi:MAG: hypothetical protein NZ898_13910 [Myxococcota bacterium]|nr:hypothetical protein [Myxococcota bacterium]MDW8363898.1 hypothetical protein [Myxococcales bacterium]
MTSLLLGLVVTLGCGDDEPPRPGDAGVDADSRDAGRSPELEPDCDPIVPEVCAFPWPSAFYLRADATSPTGWRLRIPPVVLGTRGRGEPIGAGPVENRDGFSVNAAMLAQLPGAVPDGLPNPSTIGRSVEPDSPTVVLDVDAGERVPHFVQIDDDRSNRLPGGGAIMIHAVRPLRNRHRHIVAIRGVRDRTGVLIEPSPAFRALRDGGSHPHPSVEARRAHFEELFARLSEAGIDRGTLQLAWDFRTASLEDDTGTLLAMRDDALGFVGPSGPAYSIANVEERPREGVLRLIEGRMTVPIYLTDGAAPGSTLVRDASGRPQRMGTAEFPFRVLVPEGLSSAEPGALLQVGHGLFGSRLELDRYRDYARRFRYVLFGVDWIGMSEEDAPGIAEMLANAEIERFSILPDRTAQGIVNAVLAMRLMRGRFASDPLVRDAGGPLYDPSTAYYRGSSQGGIYGATYVSISPDVTRGVLDVAGQPYNLLLLRSVDFDPFYGLLRISLREGTRIVFVLNLVQQLWDRVDPGSFTRHLERDPLPGTPPHRALLTVAIGDHQVTPLGAHVMARAIGAPLVVPAPRSIWGISEVAPTDARPHEGSALVEFDFGLPPEPLGPEPLREGTDPHEGPRTLEAWARMTDRFLRTGQVVHTCDGPCDPE